MAKPIRAAAGESSSRLFPEATSPRPNRAAVICGEDVEINRLIGLNGLESIREIARQKGDGRVNVLTHCNAGWPATVDWGTATSPICRAVEEGIDVHVFVGETRSRNGGAQLTSWELNSHELIVDNAGGHLMQHGEIDLAIVDTDRTTARGDVCNTIGTYLKALAAKANGVPFYLAPPRPPSTGRLWTGLGKPRSRSARATRSPMSRAALRRDGSPRCRFRPMARPPGTRPSR